MKYLLYFACFFVVLPCRAQKETFLGKLIPHFTQVQFAGNIGLLSAGFGYNLAKDHLHLSLLDGYTPARIAGSGINTIALRANYDLASMSIKKVAFAGYGGLGVNFETTGHGFYTKLPDRYPEKYYRASALHATVALGLKVQIPVGDKQEQRLELYGETGTIDTYLYYYLVNNNLRLTEIFSAAIGLSYHFGRRALVL